MSRQTQNYRAGLKALLAFLIIYSCISVSVAQAFELVAEPPSLEFSLHPLQGVRDTVLIYELDGANLQLNIVENCSWLFPVFADSPVTPFELDVWIDASTDTGVYLCEVLVTAIDEDSAVVDEISIPVTLYITRDYECGDANDDGRVNILDVCTILLYLYKCKGEDKCGWIPENVDACDVNGNASINILDVVYLINYIYKGGPPLMCW
ncbi:MAG: hypothetical protein CVT49_12565 [candidate division Zixibacteria bacterium HGW-Zixibacteria-1]|nr:MAG: hypothetical protein CVT49_12565 [candidate division Zixibacteria bacterium HGW-Zixibacteria-1]